MDLSSVNWKRYIRVKYTSMKPMLSLIALLLISGCNSTSTDSTQLEQRVSNLEYRIDSLINVLSINSYAPEKKKQKKEQATVYSAPNAQTRKSTVTTGSYSFAGQCMAITKKGTRCSRKARSNGYCWQQGG